MRTLSSYRPQHDANCASRVCRCGQRHKGKRCATSGNPEFHDFDPPACSCGLDMLLQSLSDDPQVGDIVYAEGTYRK